MLCRLPAETRRSRRIYSGITVVCVSDGLDGGRCPQETSTIVRAVQCMGVLRKSLDNARNASKPEVWSNGDSKGSSVYEGV
jgi:hypothetical protein